MRADTVAEAVAAHYGVAKSELLDREAPDMAVRLALGETHIIAETKRALGDAGAGAESAEGGCGWELGGRELGGRAWLCWRRCRCWANTVGRGGSELPARKGTAAAGARAAQPG